MSLFRRILIANRGEIACRVIRTARRLGIGTVAVHSEADAGALHVALADESWPIGPAPARESYLRIDRILDAARRSGAEAVHPGYGFLSENADFAEACAAAGLVFIGPPPAAIRAMGSKAAAKALMQAAGVPLVPGYHGEGQEEALLAAEAARIGFPLLIKASAGGGGKGMRVVERAADLPEALAAARREARAAFGDDRVLLERYLTAPRHIEVQVFADRHGRVIALHERDCSVQRRHQKVLEEAPAPGLAPERRARMAGAACAAARAVGYVGAGTVEFIAEGEDFHFMEMNTRLQVEHPVTEAITGLDLVEWQIRVAAGQPLPLAQDEVPLRGHAIEARIYAEDPAEDFRPSTGRLLRLVLPGLGEGIRIDSGVRQGDVITADYDPMIAKLIAHGADRAEALSRLWRALAACLIAGPRSNLDLLRAIAAHPDFAAGAVETGFIARHPALLAPPAPSPDEARMVLAAAALFLRREAEVAAARSGEPHSPWALADAWRLNGAGHQDILLQPEGGEVLPLRLHGPLSAPPGGWRLEGPGGMVLRVAATEAGLGLDGVTRPRPEVLRQGEDRLLVLAAGREHRLRVIDPLAPPGAEAAGAEHVVAPIPARVVRLLVAEGAVVPRHAPLLVLEAMKTELTLRAPMAGTIARIAVAEGDGVEEGARLVDFTMPA